MGVVYRANQISLDRIVAVKMLIEQFAKDEEFIERFRREARVVAALNHPNVLAIHDIRQVEGNWFIISEYAGGGTLRHLLNNINSLPVNEACRILYQVCSALYYTHCRGVIHRDIKPDNIMFNETLQVKVADFGLARFSDGHSNTRPGVSMGTPSYMSPEQGGDRVLDHRSDIYALGVLFFEMLTGRLPFQAENPFAVVIKHMNAKPPRPSEINPDLPSWLDQVVLKCLQKDPNDRYTDCRELANALGDASENVVQLDWMAPVGAIKPDPLPFSVRTDTPLRKRRPDKRSEEGKGSDQLDAVLGEVRELLISADERAKSHTTSPKIPVPEDARRDDALGKYQGRMSSLLELCQEWDCTLPEEVLLHIAAHSEGKGREELAGILQRLISTSLATGKPISTALATELLC